MEQELAGEKEDQTECFTCEFTADDADNVALRTPQISKQMSLDEEWTGEKEVQTECFTCEFTADDADSKHQILAFENEANRQLQFSSLSSKLVVRDELAREFHYICNQNFEQQKYFHCVAQLDEIWMVWNFHQKN
jgi:hypothetical protein